MFIPVFTVVLVVILLAVLVWVLGKKLLNSEKKMTSFECGVDSWGGWASGPFSVRFILIGIIFLIFEIEMIIMYSVTLAQMVMASSRQDGAVCLSLFIFFVIFGVVLEVVVNSLNWK